VTTFDLGLRPSAPVTTPATAAVELPSTRGGLLDWLRLVAAVLARTVLFSVLGLALWGALPLAIGWHPTTVMTGSMEPRVHVGDVVVAAPVAEADLHRGQVLLFDDPDQAGHLRLHRYDSDAAGGLLVTKGDANPQADSTPVERSAVEGVAVLRVPFVGLPVTWAREGRVGHLLVTGGLLVLTVVLSRADAGLRARLRDDERPEARVDPDGDLAPVTPRGERRAARRRERRARRLRTLGAGTAVVAVAGVAVAGIAASGGAWAAYAAPTANPTSSYAASAGYECLTEPFQGSPLIAYSYSEASGTAATDSSGAGRTGTLSSGVSRNAGSCATNDSPYVTLDGRSGQITTPTQMAGPNTFTAQTWFRTSTAGSTSGGVLFGFTSTQSSTPGQYDRHVYMNPAGRLVFGVYPNTVKTVTSPASYADGTWHLATATLSSAGMVLYVDGRAVASDTSVRSGESVNGWWRAGYSNVGNWPTPPTNNWFAGSLDETSFSSTALTAAQVQAAFAAGH